MHHWFCWTRDVRRPVWTQLPIPLYPCDWPGHPPLQPGEELEQLISYQQKFGHKRPVAGGVRGVFNHIKRPWSRAWARMERRRGGGSEHLNQWALNRLKTRLVDEFEPVGIEFKRTLGQGGFGAVFLFHMVAEKGLNYPIVVKGSTREVLDDSDALVEEIENLNWMNGASHFVQRIFLQDLPLPTASRRRRIRLTAQKGMAAVREVAKQTGDIIHAFCDVVIAGKGEKPQPETWQHLRAASAPDRVPGYTAQELEELRYRRYALDHAQNIVVLENMARGDVHDLIKKLMMKRLRLSNRALWTIFECLFKGCVGMATPGRFHQDGQEADAHAMAEQDETVPEWLHDGTQLPPRPMVHFDIDPQNALVGNFGEPGGPHEHVPMIKIADPGLAVIIDDDVRNDEAALWNLRLRGKVQYLQPEQFTREWDYRAAIDLTNLAAESMAGNYNWWSNIDQIGWIMWSLVTQCFPPAPPRALPYTYASEQAGVFEDESGFTYGMHIMATEYDFCDLELRRQILRCLDHDPTRRPKMGWFEAVFVFNVYRPDLVEAESDEQLRAHMKLVYSDPEELKVFLR